MIRHLLFVSSVLVLSLVFACFAAAEESMPEVEADYLMEVSRRAVESTKEEFAGVEKSLLKLKPRARHYVSLISCDGAVSKLKWEISCLSGTGKIPNTAGYYLIFDWNVKNIEYNNGSVKGISSVSRNKVTDMAGEVSVTFQFGSDRIHATQASYPIVYNTILSNRKGNLAINGFFRMIDDYWVKWMRHNKIYYYYSPEKENAKNPYWLMNSFVTHISENPENVITSILSDTGDN